SRSNQRRARFITGSNSGFGSLLSGRVIVKPGAFADPFRRVYADMDIFSFGISKTRIDRVVDDNHHRHRLIWSSDEELIAAIKREVPSFNRSAPDIGNTNEAIRKALQNLLAERK